MWKKILQSGWFTGVVVTALAGLGASLYKLKLADHAVGLEQANLQNKLAAVRRAAAEREQQNASANNPAWLEQQARLKLNYKRPDENVVFVYRNQYDGKTGSADSQGTIDNSQNQKWWWRLWQWLKVKIR